MKMSEVRCAVDTDITASFVYQPFPSLFRSNRRMKELHLVHVPTLHMNVLEHCRAECQIAFLEVACQIRS